ncbi:MAG TPA: SCO family protein [Edaphobacter sp.]
MRFRRFGSVAVLGAMLFGAALWGQQLNDSHPLGAAQNGAPKYLKDAGLVERLNQPLPVQASFVDEAGTQVTLAKYFHQRPVALALVYFKCAMLCPQVLHGMSTALRGTGFTAGKDYDVVVVSIDPMDSPQDAAEAKKTFLAELGQPNAGDGVHFLTGKQAEITALSEATGFHYVRVPGPDGKMDQFAHSSVIMFATPDGRMSEYLSGIEYPSRDVRLALVNASHLKIASAKDLFLLYCCNYVPSSGKYTVAVLRLLGLAGVVTLAGMGFGFYMLSRKGAGSTLAG